MCWALVALWDGKKRKSKEPFTGIRIVWLMPTLKQFRQVHQQAILNELGGRWAALGGVLNRSTMSITFPGGSTIIPFPAAEYASQKARGMRADVIIGDEFDDIDLAVYDAVAKPWMTEPWSLGLVIGAGTPRRGRHGLLWRNFERGKRGDKVRAGEAVEGDAQSLSNYFSSQATHADVPEYVSAAVVAEERANLPPETFAREWEANFDAGEGLVYSVFRPDFHVRPHPQLNQFSEFVVGVDWGYVDAAVMLLIGIRGHGADAEAWVLDEFYEKGATVQDMVEKAKTWAFTRATFYCDPSQPPSIKSLQQVCNAVKAENEILGGIARVVTMMAIRKRENGPDYARLFFAPNVKNTIRELGLYRRKRDAANPDGFLEKPEDKHNHAMDALRYAIVGRFNLGGARHVASGR